MHVHYACAHTHALRVKKNKTKQNKQNKKIKKVEGGRGPNLRGEK